jgi:hypothetical protein
MKMLTVLFGAAAGVAATISVGAGIAAAVPDVVGQTYNDAKQTIQGSGSAIVIATRTGGLAETDKCLVTNAWDKPSVTLPRQAPDPRHRLGRAELQCRSRIGGFAGKLCCQPGRPSGVDLPGRRLT